MKIRVTHITGEYEEIDTEAKFTTAQLCNPKFAQLRTKVRFDQLTDFEDGRPNGLWLELWGARFESQGDIIDSWVPLCMVRQLADTELDYIAKVTSSREDASGGADQLEMCRVWKDDGKSVLVSFARARAFIDLYGSGGDAMSATEVVYSAFKAWCKAHGKPVSLSYVAEAAAELEIDPQACERMVELAMEEELALAAKLQRD